MPHLMVFVSRNISLSSVVGVILDSESKWSAAVFFCVLVMTLKEAMERVRESRADADPSEYVGVSHKKAICTSPTHLTLEELLQESHIYLYIFLGIRLDKRKVEYSRQNLTVIELR